MHHGNGNGAIEEDPEIMPFRQEIFEKPEKTAKLEKLYLVSPSEQIGATADLHPLQA